LEDLAEFFYGCGHDVTVVSTRAEPHEHRYYNANVERVLFRRPQRVSNRTFGDPASPFWLAGRTFFRRRRFYLIFSLNYYEAAAAVLANIARSQREQPRVIYYQKFRS
jgi:hypothetical protein